MKSLLASIQKNDFNYAKVWNSRQSKIYVLDKVDWSKQKPKLKVQSIVGQRA
jgi:hypothetical protein